MLIALSGSTCDIEKCVVSPLGPIFIVDNFSQGKGGFKLPNSFYIISQRREIVVFLEYCGN